MRYGGENEATYVVEVFRKCQDETLDAYEREAEQNSITVGVFRVHPPAQDVCGRSGALSTPTRRSALVGPSPPRYCDP